MTTKSLEDYTPAELVEHARKLEQESSLFRQLTSDPETRGDALRLLKKKNPGMPIPEIDTKIEAEKLVATERAEREKLEVRVRNGEIRERIAAERERVKKEYDLSDADLLEVEKLMVDEKAPINHYDGAAKVYKASRQQATPTSHVLTAKTFDMPSKDKWGAGVGNKAALSKIFTNEAYAALNELRGGKAA